MTLTKELQYIGRSTPVGCGAGYHYYLLVFAAAVPEPEQGGHRVRIRTLLACDADASFYGFATSASAFIGQTALYHWQRRQTPADYWGSSEGVTVGGILYPRWTELASGEALVQGTLAGAELTLMGDWSMESTLDRDWFPNTGEKADFRFPVVLSPGPGQTAVTVKGPVVFGDATPKLELALESPVPGASFLLKLGMGENICFWEGKVTQSAVSVEADPETWLPRLRSDRDTSSWPDSEAPYLLVTTVDSDANVLEQTRHRFDIVVTEACAPRIRDVLLKPVSVLAAPFQQRYVQSCTAVTAEIDGEGLWGADIRSWELKVEGVCYTEQTPSVTSGFLQSCGQTAVWVTVTDSRGFRSSRELGIYVMPYRPPVLLTDFCGRCDASGNPQDQGRFLRVSATGKSSPMEDMENPCCLELRWRTQDGAFGDWKPLTDMTSPEIRYSEVLADIVDDPARSYCIRLRCRDAVGGCTVTELTVAPEEVYLHRTPRGLGIGKYVEEQELVDCRWNLWLRGSLRLGDEGISLEEYIRSILEEYNGNL